MSETSPSANAFKGADALRRALSDLLEQVASLEGYTLTRDLDRYKAQANWDDTVSHAQDALAASGGECIRGPHCTGQFIRLKDCACGAKTNNDGEWP